MRSWFYGSDAIGRVIGDWLDLADGTSRLEEVPCGRLRLRVSSVGVA